MDADLKQKWSEFLEGDWQKEMPTSEGIYLVCTCDGYQGKNLYVYDNGFGKLIASQSWEGFWWSIPLPSLPKLGEK